MSSWQVEPTCYDGRMIIALTSLKERARIKSQTLFSLFIVTFLWSFASEHLHNLHLSDCKTVFKLLTTKTIPRPLFGFMPGANIHRKKKKLQDKMNLSFPLNSCNKAFVNLTSPGSLFVTFFHTSSAGRNNLQGQRQSEFKRLSVTGIFSW